MINWKRVLPLTLGLMLSVQSVAYGELIIPPVPIGTQAGTLGGQTGGQGPGVVTAGESAGTSQTPDGGQSGAGTGQTSDAGQSSAGTQQTPDGGQSGAGTSQTMDAARNLQQPQIAAEGAVLIDGATGKVLFGKNENQQFFPASITKVMTALLVLERCSLSDVVTFSATATTNLESGAVALGVSEGDQLTVEQSLYGLLLKSANEIGNGLAEHVAGSVSAFADLMNEKAKALGCQNTHFTNPHGLNDPNHLTTPYDMALIMRAALKNETFRKIDTTTSYSFPALKNEPARTITMGHKMMYSTDSRYYPGIIGGKTGYTSKAGNTLVTGAERDGIRLIAVVMKSARTHYTDTKAMLDYGFANYQTLMGTSAGTAADPSGSSAGNTVTVPSGTNGSGSAEGAAGGPGVSAQQNQEPGWHQDDRGWYYIVDGKKTANTWQTIDGLDYWFDGDGYMATGWRQYSNGAWYYFKPSIGYMMKNCWISDGGNWYYLGSDGAMLTNTTTPDGYPVDANGIWQQ